MFKIINTFDKGLLQLLNLNLMNPLALQDVDNEMLRDADEYLRKHKVLELFEVSYFIVCDACLSVGFDYLARLQAAR